MTTTSDRGQATPLMAAAVVLAAVIVLVLVDRAGVTIDAARARTASDAAALAGAAEDRAAAERQARANGGRVVDYRVDGADVVVTVRVGDATAVARARRVGEWCVDDGLGEGDIPYTSSSCRTSLGPPEIPTPPVGVPPVVPPGPAPPRSRRRPPPRRSTPSHRPGSRARPPARAAALAGGVASSGSCAASTFGRCSRCRCCSTWC